MSNGSSDKIYCLYLYENLINGKVYVGQTIDLKRRHNQHKRGDSSMAIDHAIHKYGADNFCLSIILYSDTLEQINQEEIYWIARLRDFLGKKNIYNIYDGGNNIDTQPDEVKLKISNSMKLHIRTEEHKNNISKSKLGNHNPMFGKQHSKDHNDKISKTMIGENNHFYGKTHSEETKKKMSEAKKGKGWILVNGKRIWGYK